MSNQGNDSSGQCDATATVREGKGKAVDQPPDVSMDEEDDSSDTGAEEEPLEEEAEDSDPDNMEAIDTDNIIKGGRRTRGVVVDFLEANKKAGIDLDDDEEEEDEDFEDEDEDETMEG